MPLIPPLQPEEASKEITSLYEDFHRRMSFPAPPNFIKTQGHSSAVTQGTSGLVLNVLVGGVIPRWTKEMIFVAISIDRNCKYCEAAHLACCRMLGVNAEVIAALVKDVSTIQDAKVREMVLFALKCSRDPQSLQAQDYSRLRAHGLGQSEIVELIAMSGLAVYANIMADATQMDADKIFSTLSGGMQISDLRLLEEQLAAAEEIFVREFTTASAMITIRNELRSLIGKVTAERIRIEERAQPSGVLDLSPTSHPVANGNRRDRP